MEEFSLPDRWSPISSERRQSLNAELARELCSNHPLFGIQAEVMAALDGYDDLLFRLSGASIPFAIVHLTWNVETSADFPWTTFFESFEDFRQNWKRIWD
jgi:hypothetical protein